MGDKTVFLSEYISEDTNPWDSRERFGLYTSFPKAVKSMQWLIESSDDARWVETDHYGGSHYGQLVKRCWKWAEKNERGTYEDDDDGYGIYIWEEYLDGEVQE
jgi:hypothetical protein